MRNPAAIRTRDGVNLFCRYWGEGRAVLFVHSWGLSSRMWDYQIQDLSALGMRCIAFDRRGHGRSDQPGEGYDMDTFADDLAAVVEGLALNNAVLVGHSMGAAEILRYIGRHGSQRVAKIILLAPLAPYFQQGPDNQRGVPQAALNDVRAQWMMDFPRWIEDNKLPFFSPESSPQLMTWLLQDMHTTSLPVLVACNKTLVETDLRGDLAKIDRPALIIHGDADASAPLEITGRPTAEGIKGATLKVYPGAPHGLFLTHRRQLNDDMATFIRA